MATEKLAQEFIQVASERRGSRWLHAQPAAEEITEWFMTQSLHPPLVHKDYVGGIVLINSTEKIKVTRQRAQTGGRYVEQIEQAVFTPYIRVDTRVRYFWDLVDTWDNHYGVIEPDEVPRITDPNSPHYNGHMPKGYSFQAMREGGTPQGTIVRHICFTAHVAIYNEQGYADRLAGRQARTVVAGTATKAVPMLNQYNRVDENAMMKAETGGVGRALGMAGMLVIGTGVATAEDMLEFTAPAPPPPALPVIEEPSAGNGQPATREQMLERFNELDRRLREADEDVRRAVYEWWRGRDFGAVEDLSDEDLRTAVIKFERELDTATR